MKQLFENWLSALCELLPDVRRAAVFSTTAGTSGSELFVSWPEGEQEQTDLREYVPNVLDGDGCTLVRNSDAPDGTGEPCDVLATPLYILGKRFGACVIEISSLAPANQQGAIAQMERAAVWLQSMFRQYSALEKNQLVTLVELVSSCLEHQSFQSAATDVMTELATRLPCSRVSLGIIEELSITVKALSHSGAFDSRSNLIRDMGEVMFEAIDQTDTLVYPPSAESHLITRCHRSFAEEHGTRAILTIPFAIQNRLAGAVLLERDDDQPYDQTTKELCEHIVSLVGPMLVIRYRDERSPLASTLSSLRSGWAKMTGPGNVVAKAGGVGLLLLLILLTFASGEYRVTGRAILEAELQRVVVASQDGFIASTNVRPGDIIRQGDLLAALDDKDLTLEQRKWSSKLKQMQTEYRDAFAKHDRSKVTIITARMHQAEAQLNLIDEQLSRTRLTAPFDGLIVSGDLSQALGSPVERGQVLFTVAPLNTYRVILQVDERDIATVKEGQGGSLVLSCMPDKVLPFTVEKITPVSTPEEGRNYFKVETSMEQSSDLLRPGMEGVAKIHIDRRKLLWIWGHKLVDWLRLTLWSYLP